MMVRVKLFAVARQAAGSHELAVDVRDGATLADVREKLVAAAPALEDILPHARWAVDAEFAGDESKPITAQSEVALIPPVSGG
jgi:molybdopterin converting factor small subunit